MSRISSVADKPAPGPHFTQIIEVRDFLAVHLPRLAPKHRQAVERWAAGQSVREIAGDLGEKLKTVEKRLRTGLEQLKRFAGDGEK